MSENQIRIAAAQVVTGEDPQQNLEIVRKWTNKAAQAGAKVVVFPEATQQQFGHDLASIAEPCDGNWASQVRAIAEDAGIVVVVGMFTPAPASSEHGSRVVNTVLVTGPDSEKNWIDTSYDKIHVYDAFGFKESDTVSPGQEPVRFELDGITFGLAICYDVRFPHLFTAHARAGTQVTLLPTSWGAGPGKVDQWQVLTRARALDSTQYLVASGQALPSAAGLSAPAGSPTGIGHSAIIAPNGEVLTEAGEAPELLVADINMDVVETTRKSNPVLANAREI